MHADGANRQGHAPEHFANFCTELQVAPSTYYAAKSRPFSARVVRDEKLKVQIQRIHTENYSVYGARKVWRQLRRDGVEVARCTVERLMCQLGLAGIVRGKARRTVPTRQ